LFASEAKAFKAQDRAAKIHGWHWIFFVNVPLGIMAVLLAVRAIDADRGIGLRSSADWLGAILATAGLMLGVYAIDGTIQYGWGSSRTLLAAALAVALLAAFVIRQATARILVLPLRIFSVRAVTSANLAQLLVIAAAFGFQVIVTLYMQRVLGDSAATSDLGLLPTAAVIGTVSLGFSARIAARFGHRLMLLAGLLLIAVSLTLLVRGPVHGGYLAHLLGPLVLFGAGGGLTRPALASLGMSGATQSDAGLASGLFNTAQQISAALGVAALSTLAAARTTSLHVADVGSAAALTSGYRLAFATGAGLTVAAALVTAVLLRSTGSAPHRSKIASTVTRHADR
jgi:MFS family permease